MQKKYVCQKKIKKFYFFNFKLEIVNFELRVYLLEMVLV